MNNCNLCTHSKLVEGETTIAGINTPIWRFICEVKNKQVGKYSFPGCKDYDERVGLAEAVRELIRQDAILAEYDENEKWERDKEASNHSWL